MDAITKKYTDFVLPLFKLLFVPLARIVLGEWIDAKTTRTIFMDQVMVPKAQLFSKAYFINQAKKLNCELKDLRYVKYGLVIEGLFKKQR